MARKCPEGLCGQRRSTLRGRRFKVLLRRSPPELYRPNFTGRLPGRALDFAPMGANAVFVWIWISIALSIVGGAAALICAEAHYRLSRAYLKARA